MGDARRCLERLHSLKGEAARATARRQTGRARTACASAAAGGGGE